MHYAIFRTSYKCTEKCETLLPCGHKCTGTCFKEFNTKCITSFRLRLSKRTSTKYSYIWAYLWRELSYLFEKNQPSFTFSHKIDLIYGTGPTTLPCLFYITRSSHTLSDHTNTSMFSFFFIIIMNEISARDCVRLYAQCLQNARNMIKD